MSQIDTERLKTHRRDRGWTQKQLAEASGVSYSTLTKLEQGTIDAPSITLLNDVAVALGARMEEFVQADSPEAIPHEKIQFVYFDVGGVLVRSIEQSLEAFAAQLGRSDHAVKAIFHEHAEAGARGNMKVEDLKLLMMLRLNVALDAQERQNVLARSWIDDMRSIPAGHQLLRAVGACHAIGLLTNVFRGYYPDFFQRGLVPDCRFKAVVKSCDVGYVKPEPEMYDVATQAAQTEPGNILLIDDSQMNVRAAREFGWWAEQFDECHPQASVQRIMCNWFRG